MKLLATLLLLSQFTWAADQQSSTTLVSDCIQSYSEAKSYFFDVIYNENDPQKHVIFRAGKYFNAESINIYHNGQYWQLPIPIDKQFYSKKVALVKLGPDTFCMTYEFNWLRRDKFVLTNPLSEKACPYTETLELQPAKPDTKPSSEEILITKLIKDLEGTTVCLKYARGRDEEGRCREEERYTEYRRQLKWNTAACEKIDNPVLKKAIAERNKTMSDYRDEMSYEVPKSSQKQQKSNSKTNN